MWILTDAKMEWTTWQVDGSVSIQEFSDYNDGNDDEYVCTPLCRIQ